MCAVLGEVFVLQCAVCLSVPLTIQCVCHPQRLPDPQME